MSRITRRDVESAIEMVNCRIPIDKRTQANCFYLVGQNGGYAIFANKGERSVFSTHTLRECYTFLHGYIEAMEDYRKIYNKA